MLGKKRLIQAEEERRALLEMYQAGFLDGYNTRTTYKHRFTKTIQKECFKAFEFRFVKSIQEALNKYINFNKEEKSIQEALNNVKTNTKQTRAEAKRIKKKAND